MLVIASRTRPCLCWLPGRSYASAGRLAAASRGLRVRKRPAHGAAVRAAHFRPRHRRGRVIFVPPADEPGFLEHQLSAHPGLLPPGLIICLPQVSQSRLEQVRTICANCASAVSAARARRLQELATAPPPTLAATCPPRLAVLALQLDPAAQDVARALEDAAPQA